MHRVHAEVIEVRPAALTRCKFHQEPSKTFFTRFKYKFLIQESIQIHLILSHQVLLEIIMLRIEKKFDFCDQILAKDRTEFKNSRRPTDDTDR